MNTFSYIFLITLFANLAVNWWLILRQQKHVDANKHQVPDAFLDKLTLEEHQKAAVYTTARIQYKLFKQFYLVAFLLLLTLFGGLGYLDNLWNTTNLNSVSRGIGFIASYVLLIFLTEIPLGLYSTFILEEKFGFNRTRLNTFITDRIKAVAITAVLGIPLAWIILWVMQVSGDLWWLYVWLIYTFFNLFIIWAYPAFIAPLFNKFTLLKDKELSKRIETLLIECGFRSKGVYVMDGSRRSAHNNAFFSGIGNNKRIVFFDTLLKTLNKEEIEAVLAHELGHFKLNHIKKQFAIGTFISLISFAILGLLIDESWFYQGMQITSNPSNHVGLVLFFIVLPVFTFFFNPFFSYLSRKHEFEADEFAAKCRNPLFLISALVKLTKKEKSTVTPDPVYAKVFYSHPPEPIRIDQLYKLHNAQA